MGIVNKWSFENDIIQVKIINGPKHPKMIARVFNIVKEAGVNVDMISQVSIDKNTQIEFTCDSKYQHELNEAIVALATQFEDMEIYQDRTLYKIALGGDLMEKTPGAAAKVFTILGDNDIHFHQVTTSKRTISILISKEDSNKAMKVLSEAFNL